jgi:periplasmic copper chaperone A
MKAVRKLVLTLGAAAAAALVLAAVASAHARVSPPVVEKDAPEVFTLSVPTENEGLTTTKIELTVPSDFPIDSVEPPPAGWTMNVKATGSGEEAVIQGITWSGGHVPTGQAAMFNFAAQANNSGTTTFSVRQTYSDGSVVDWNGPESSDTPSPTIKAVDSLGGGGGTSTLEIVALVIAIAALVVGVLALVGGGKGKRTLA